jgi:hypothetical protein
VFIWSDVTDTTLGDFLYITDVQLEPGTVATPFERRSFGQELALCQRYYEVGKHATSGYASGVSSLAALVPFAVTKRAAPTVSIDSADQLTNIANIASDAVATGSFRCVATTASVTGGAFSRGNWIASAEL